VTNAGEIMIELNGQSAAVPAGTTLADLVSRTLPNARAYAVELNRAVVSRREHATRAVAAGDKVEIVTLVGGG
jgi:sulfur carrier protein